MRYRIEHETSRCLRIRHSRNLPEERAEAAAELLRQTPGILSVRRFKATNGMSIEHELDRNVLLGLLDELNGETVRQAAEEVRKEQEEILERLRKIKNPHLLEKALLDHRVDARELSARKLDPELKRKMRLRILGEAFADLLLPAPVQAVYHAWQIITLKSF